MAQAETALDLAPEASWGPADFILRGRFCPRAYAYDAVEEARQHAGASAALVVAADEGALLRSLCFQAPKEPGSPTDLVGLLRGSSDLNSAGLRNLALTLGDGGESERFPRSAKALLLELERFARDAGREEMARWLSSAEDWVPVRVPDSVRDARISAAVLFLNPTSHLTQTEDGLRVVEADQHLVDITQRINATAQADVRRDAAIMARLDNRFDPADYVTRTVDFAQAAKSLVVLAREISGSDVGACYIFDHDVKSMRLEASKLPEELAGQWHYENELALDSNALVLNCFSTRRPVQLPPGPPDAKQLKMTCRPVGDSDAGESCGTVELATPIVGPLASPKARAVGVLTVARLNSDTAYGAYDHALLRNIALRLSLISATTNSEEAAHTFTQLSGGAVRGQDAKWAGVSATEHDRDGQLPVRVVGRPLPNDFKATLGAITQGLATLGRVTGSHSATFRAALPDEATQRSHGLVLRRVAAHPAHWMEDGNEIQTMEQGGINWRVVLEGRPYYAPVVASAKNYLQRREETVSELSVPVFVEGRVVGTVNLESADRNAYDAQVATAHAFAAYVGLTIANARIAIAGVLNNYATAIVERGHEIGRECKELRIISHRLESEDAAKVFEIANAVERKAKGLRRFLERDRRDPSECSTLPDLVDSQLRKAVLRKVKVDRGANEVWGVHDPKVTYLIGEALKDIFHNVKRHSSTSGERARVQLCQERWGGQQQDLLVIYNRTDEYLSPSREANVFRAPLLRPLGSGKNGDPGTEVPQLGAYLAGTLIRRVGGEVHFLQGSNDQTRIVVSVPAADPHNNEGGTR